MKRTFDGSCYFAATDGKNRAVTWSIVTADDPETRKLTIDKGHICYLELRVDDETRACFDHGKWIRRPPFFIMTRTDAIAKRFVSMLIDLYH